MEGSSLKRPSGGRNGENPPLDRAIAQLAAAQHGVVALRQLVALGLSASAVRNRVAAGRLHRIHHGVYAVGYALLTRNGRFMAAVLACGATAAISHRTAAVKWSLNKLEERFLHIARDTGLPPDAVNRWIAFPDGGGAEADFVYALLAVRP